VVAQLTAARWLNAALCPTKYQSGYSEAPHQNDFDFQGAKMKIAIIGAGVIGATYGWQLQQAGNEIVHLLRPGKSQAVSEKGIRIACTDERGKGAKKYDILYQPPSTESLREIIDWDLIMVPVQRTQLHELLPTLSKHEGKSSILFFQNIWDSSAIERQLPKAKYFFGFPRIVAGVKQENSITCTIFSNPGQPTVLGEPDGSQTERLEQVRQTLEAAGLRPQISKQVLGWLAAHYVEWLGPVGAMLKAGSVESFATNKQLIRDSISATIEALAVCKARGFEKKAFPSNLNLLLTMPRVVVNALAAAQYKMPAIQAMFKGHLSHGIEEISAQYNDVIETGRRLGVTMGNLESYRDYFQKNADG
jgi:ketopantoate reductase